MLITENLTINEKAFVKNYSDAGFFVKKDGTEELYVEAVDPADAGRTYTETNIPTTQTEEPPTEEDYEAATDEIYAEAGRIMLLGDK